MAEHAREHAGLQYVAIFRHDASSHTVLEELARASMLDVEEMPGSVRRAMPPCAACAGSRGVR